ncbi:cupin domain-containing protein [Herbaspirillum rhizosphaerae]|uniref:cupin domain-containing protein n=1 Tax=Herbaspirillum rhizosphaerae TaxID=346179 RepID=UPI00067C971D|nr:cupin domain-containing protein [Herbaspirillum rhizosphaerae]
MSLFNLLSISSGLPEAWQSTVLGQVGPARIKVLRMNEMSYEEEVHDYNEGLLVLSGRMLLAVAGETVTVSAGELYLAEAGVAHAVLPGSDGCLVIVDV